MQGYVRSSTCARHIAGILRYLWADKNHLQVVSLTLLPARMVAWLEHSNSGGSVLDYGICQTCARLVARSSEQMLGAQLWSHKKLVA